MGGEKMAISPEGWFVSTALQRDDFVHPYGWMNCALTFCAATQVSLYHFCLAKLQQNLCQILQWVCMAWTTLWFNPSQEPGPTQPLTHPPPAASGREWEG